MSIDKSTGLTHYPCGLGYEIIWGRWLATILGSSATSACIVLATFMGGLAVGSWFFGGLCRRVALPLNLYIGVELFIGITAGLFPFITLHILGLPFFLRILCVVVVLFIPTFLMGGTVPLMMSWSETVNLPPGSTFGRLCGLNTLGACCGCIAAGFLLRKQGKASKISVLPTPGEHDASSTVPIWAFHVVAGLSGFVTFGLEVIWIRLLRITLGSTTYTFTIVIATFILGIGVGGLLSGKVQEHVTIAGKLAHAQWLLTSLMLFQFLILPTTPKLYKLAQHGGSPWLSALLSIALVCLIVLLPIAVLLGYMFPLIGRFYMRQGNRGAAIGRLYAINTIGAVIGSIVTTVATIPWIGTTGSYLLFIGLMMISLGIYTWLAYSSITMRFYGANVFLFLVFAGLAFSRPGWTPEYLGRGAFIGKEPLLKNLFFREGMISTVFVEEVASGRGMRVDGKAIASTVFVDRINQLLLGHLPALLTPTIHYGLVIGLGTGMTLDSLAQHQLERVEIVELEEAVVQGAQTFKDFNHAVLDRPEIVIIVDDGFNYLHATDLYYDVVTSDPIQPYFRGAATLYSTEYFDRTKRCLTSEGVVAHWLPLAQMSLDDFKMIVRSFTDVFPYARLYWTGGLFDTILVGRTTPWVTMTPEQFSRARADLASVYIESIEEMENLLIADRDIDLPILEFTAPRSFFAQTGRKNMQELIVMRQAMNRSAEGWRAISALLAYQATVAPLRDEELLQHVLLNWVGCAQNQDCETVKVSGLLRYQLWELAIRQGEHALQRYRMAKELTPSISQGSADVFFKKQLENSLSAYEWAFRLASPSHPQEKNYLRQQLSELRQHILPDSPEASRLQALTNR
jgi:spermidine synthase